jgi:uncharacterized protein YdhG (YjbR/CyaY superfamily)
MKPALLGAYLAAARPSHRAALRQLHVAIMTAVPDAELVLRRGVPAYRYLHRPLVSIGDAQSHVALYVMQGTALASHAAALQPFNTSKTVVRFDPKSAMPTATVLTLVRARADEIRRSRADAPAGGAKARPVSRSR